MKFNLLAASVIGAANAAGLCTIQLETFDPTDPTCAGSSNLAATLQYTIGECALDTELFDEPMYMFIPYCDQAVGVAIYSYEDAACMTPKQSPISPDLGCPTRGCCHISGPAMQADIDGNGTPDLSYALPYGVNVLAQSGSRYGLSVGGAIGELFSVIFG